MQSKTLSQHLSCRLRKVPSVALVLCTVLASSLAAQSSAEWGQLQQGECVDNGYRQLYAPIYVYTQRGAGSSFIVPGGGRQQLSPAAACQVTPLQIGDLTFTGADQCLESETGIFGSFVVPDATCSYTELPQAQPAGGAVGYRPPLKAQSARGQRPWGKFKPQQCSDTQPGHRNFYAQVETGKKQWFDACYNSPAVIHGWEFSAPARCLYLKAFGGWQEATSPKPGVGAIMAVGEFPIPDSTCR